VSTLAGGERGRGATELDRVRSTVTRPPSTAEAFRAVDGAAERLMAPVGDPQALGPRRKPELNASACWKFSLSLRHVFPSIPG
jgi:hypothetical protein